MTLIVVVYLLALQPVLVAVIARAKRFRTWPLLGLLAFFWVPLAMFFMFLPLESHEPSETIGFWIRRFVGLPAPLLVVLAWPRGRPRRHADVSEAFE